MVFAFINSLLSGRRNRWSNRVSRCRQSSATAYQKLEPRRVLAGIFFQASTGKLYLSGSNANDGGSVMTVNGTQVQANLTGATSQVFDAADISQIVFLGRDGDDTFLNDTAIESLQIGGAGDDQLTGGSQSDQINGGPGNDVIRGRDGDDRLIGFDGVDEIYGGTGNDRILGGDGENQLHGENGNDTIFGGSDADTITGGNGVDKIYGLPGNDIIDVGDGGTVGVPGTVAADLAQGHAGDDQITGGEGLNVFYGGDGDDELIGGDFAENRLHGGAGADTLEGARWGDLLVGGNGDDHIQGLGGTDRIHNGAGNDVVDGGGGNDFYYFTGNYNQHRINGTTTLTVRDMRDISPTQGTDTLTNMERFGFADGVFDAESPIQQAVTVRPVIVSNDNGSATAMSFGSTISETYIKNQIDDIFYQAHVDVTWESNVGWNNSFANEGNGGTRPRSDLNSVVNAGDNAGIGSSDPLVLDLYFVNVVAGFEELSENHANGLAFVDANGLMVHIGDSLLTSNSGRDVAARVIAHEIAHNLGLGHVDAPANLMDDGENLNASQVATILASEFTV